MAGVFTGCAVLTQSLSAASAIGAYDRKLAALARVPLLIIDEFRLELLLAPADEDLHDLISERYECAATCPDPIISYTQTGVSHLGSESDENETKSP